MKTMMTLVTLMVAGAAYAQDFESTPRPGQQWGGGQPSARVVSPIDEKAERIARAYRGREAELARLIKKIYNDYLALAEMGSRNAVAAYEAYVAHKRALELLRRRR